MTDATLKDAGEANTRPPHIRNRQPVEFTPDLMTEAEAAEFLRISAGTLKNWRNAEKFGLPVTYVGTTPMYLQSALSEWLKSRTVAKASDYATLPK